jgi:hypothetical protein
MLHEVKLVIVLLGTTPGIPPENAPILPGKLLGPLSVKSESAEKDVVVEKDSVVYLRTRVPFVPETNEPVPPIADIVIPEISREGV